MPLISIESALKFHNALAFFKALLLNSKGMLHFTTSVVIVAFNFPIQHGSIMRLTDDCVLPSPNVKVDEESSSLICARSISLHVDTYD